MLLKKDIYWGMMKTFCVFDSQAAPGELTDRLLDLMQRTWRDIHQPYQIKNIYIDNLGSLDRWREDDRISIVDMDKFKKYFIDEIGGAYAKEDDNLVVMIDEDNRVPHDDILSKSEEKSWIAANNNKLIDYTRYVLLGTY